MRRWIATIAAATFITAGLAAAPAAATPKPEPDPRATSVPRPPEPPGRPDDPPRDQGPPEEPSEVLEDLRAPTDVDRSLEAGIQAAPVTNRIVGTALAAGGTGSVRAATLNTTASVTDRTAQRAGGADRYATAIALSSLHFTAGASDVFIAGGETFPDGLSAATVAGDRRGPVLLTRATALPAGVAAELARLAPKNIWIVGGTGAVSAGVASAVQQAVPTAAVERLAGADRYATAAALSKRFFPSRPPAAFVVSGNDFPDALGAGPAAAQQDAPTLLVAANSVPKATETELARLRPPVVYIAGGTGVVSDTVASRIRSLTGGQVVRVAGADRYATAAAIADRFFRPTTSRVVLASGLAFPDGLGAGAVAGASASPLLLVDGVDVPPRATLDAARRVSWWLPDDGRVIRYTVVAHPDDDFAAWSLLGQPDPRRYDVVIVLTTGESSGFCTGQPVNNQWMNQQYLPQPQPTGVQYSDRCIKHRMDSWRVFMDGTDVGPVGSWQRLTGGPVSLGGRELPIPQRRSSSGAVEPADYFDLSVGADAAFVSFDMGALLPDEVLWAIQTTRGLADRFPTQVEGDVVGAAFYNDAGTGYANTSADHKAVYDALGRNDLGMPGSQYSSVGHAQSGRAFGAAVTGYCGYMCHPAASAPWKGSMGHFQYSYGWLSHGYWTPGTVDAHAGFSQYQSFAKWY